MKEKYFSFGLFFLTFGVVIQMLLPLSLPSILFFAALLMFVLLRTLFGSYPILRFIAICGSCFSVGLLLSFFRTPLPCKDPLPFLQGKVVSFVETKEAVQKFYVEYQPGCVTAILLKQREKIFPGDVLLFEKSGYVFRPNTKKPIMIYEDLLVGFVEAKTTTIVRHTSVYSIAKRMQQGREILKDKFTGLSFDGAGLFYGMVFGGKGLLSHSLLDAFTVAGIVHIIVLSGQNLSFLGLYVARYVRFLFGFRAGTILAGVLVCLYGMFGGLEPPTLRAACMVCYLLLALLLKRHVGIGYTLFVCSFFLLVFSPHLLFSASFILSVLAMIGIISVSPVIEYYLLQKGVSPSWSEYMGPIIGTQLFLLPYLCYMSGTFSTYPLLANMGVLFLVPLVLFFAPFYVFASLCSPFLATVIAVPLQTLLDMIIWVATTVSKFPVAQVSFAPSATSIGLCYGAILIFLVRVYKKFEITPLSLFILRDTYRCEERGRIPWFDEHEGSAQRTVCIGVDLKMVQRQRVDHNEDILQKNIVWD